MRPYRICLPPTPLSPSVPVSLGAFRAQSPPFGVPPPRVASFRPSSCTAPRAAKQPAAPRVLLLTQPRALPVCSQQLAPRYPSSARLRRLLPYDHRLRPVRLLPRAVVTSLLFRSWENCNLRTLRSDGYVSHAPTNIRVPYKAVMLVPAHGRITAPQATSKRRNHHSCPKVEPSSS